MRALIAIVVVALVAGSARADDQYQRGRRKQHAAIALFGMPLYIWGSSEIDRCRGGASPPPTPVATVRF